MFYIRLNLGKNGFDVEEIHTYVHASSYDFPHQIQLPPYSIDREKSKHFNLKFQNMFK